MEATSNPASKRSSWLPSCIPFFIVLMLTTACINGQDISACCDKAMGACRSVCEKMSSINVTSGDLMREERIHNIHRFCPPHLVEFWICINQTIHEVVSGSEWWGRACCATARAASCRAACASANDARALTPAVCRQSDELPLFDCVQQQQEAQWCCSQTQSLSCHEACRDAMWKPELLHAATALRDRALEACDQSPPLLQCLRDLTATTLHEDAASYLPCCSESPLATCRAACVAALQDAGGAGGGGVQQAGAAGVAAALAAACGAPALHSALWQCFLRRAAPSRPAAAAAALPRDAAKLHCCYKAVTPSCKESCFNTFNIGWQNHWQHFHAECLDNPDEATLAQCIEEVEAPCSPACSGGVSYCSALTHNPASTPADMPASTPVRPHLYRACNAQADQDARRAAADAMERGFVKINGYLLPLRNSSQCSPEVWRAISCALHIKPCTTKGHSSLLCVSACLQLVSVCAGAGAEAGALCRRVAAADPRAPCLTAADILPADTDSLPSVRAEEAGTYPCAGSPCNASQVCRVNRNCVHAACPKYTCVDGCPLGDESSYVIPIGSWARIPMPSTDQKACYKICRCGPKGLTQCQPLPCVAVENCVVQDKVIKDGSVFWSECNLCVCRRGARSCSRRPCGRARRVWRLPCSCPPHHVPAHTPRASYPNSCLAQCAGEGLGSGGGGGGEGGGGALQWGARVACGRAACGRRAACVAHRTACLSPLQPVCPHHVCVNTSNCHSQPYNPVCDTDGRTHNNPCHLIMGGRRFAYWGECLQHCSPSGTVCGADGLTYGSECAAWSEHVSVDYAGACVAVGPISDAMEPKCLIDAVPCDKPRARCAGATPPGACCPKCGGALRILYSKKEIDRALYGTNISSSVINLRNLLTSLERFVEVAECALRGYLTVEQEIFVLIESILKDPTPMQLHLCILEAEKIADLINRESPLISSDLGLSALSLALIVHSHPVSSCGSLQYSVVVLLVSILGNYFR